MLGWWRLRAVPGARAPLLFGAASLLLQILAGSLNFSGSHTSQRHFAEHGFFLAIGGGALLGELRGVQLSVVLPLLLALRLGLSDTRKPPLYLDRELQEIAARVRPTVDMTRGEVLVELADFPSLAVPVLLDRTYVVWDRESAPGRDEPRAEASVFTRAPPALRAWMAEEHVGVILTTTRKGAARAGMVATRVHTVGPYAAFVVGGSAP